MLKPGGPALLEAAFPSEICCKDPGEIPLLAGCQPLRQELGDGARLLTAITSACTRGKPDAAEIRLLEWYN